MKIEEFFKNNLKEKYNQITDKKQKMKATYKDGICVSR